VANLRRMIQVNKKEVEGFNGTPSELYSMIRKVVLKQRVKFEIAYKKILAELEKESVFHIDEATIDEKKKVQVASFFHDSLKHAIVPIILDKRTAFPRLLDYAIYLAVKMTETNGKIRYALIQIPPEFKRFFIISEGRSRFVLLLDDIIRIHLMDIFPIFNIRHIEAYTFKFTRDAELNLDDDISVSLIEKIEKSIKNRKKGIPVRFVYDERMPKDLLDHLLRS
jgi:polyphosphate kinase